MTSNKKLIIQILALINFSIILYRNWDNHDVRNFYVQILIGTEILIDLIYFLVNKKKLSQEEKDREIISIIIMLIALFGFRLFSLFSKFN